MIENRKNMKNQILFHLSHNIQNLHTNADEKMAWENANHTLKGHT